MKVSFKKNLKRRSGQISQSDESNASFMMQGGPQYEHFRNTSASSMLKQLLNIQNILNESMNEQQFRNILVKNSEFDSSPIATPNKSSAKKTFRGRFNDTLPTFQKSAGGLVKGVKHRDKFNKRPKVPDLSSHCISSRQLSCEAKYNSRKSSVSRSQDENLVTQQTEQVQNDYIGLTPRLTITTNNPNQNTKIFYGS